ncbi:MAG: hypothetical protein IKF55_06195, partial [Oscillospiraceae bacterium]|nr:hypothetical protein [Oscillospiraceae bacterium]
MKYWRNLMLTVLVCLMLAGITTAFADGVGDYTDAFGIEECYVKTTDSAVTVTIPSAEAFPETQGSSYTLSLWSVSGGEPAATGMRETGKAPGSTVSFPLSNVNAGMYFIRVSRVDNGETFAFDAYFEVKEAENNTGEPALTLNTTVDAYGNQTVCIGKSSLVASVSAPGASEVFLTVGGDTQRWEGEYGFFGYDFDSAQTVSIRGTAVYPGANGGSPVVKEAVQTVQVTASGSIGDVRVVGLPAGSAAGSFSVTLSPVENADEILAAGRTITYSARLFDVTDGNFVSLLREDYSQAPDGVTDAYPALGSGKEIRYSSLENGHTYYYTFSASAPGFGLTAKRGYLLADDEAAQWPLVTVNGSMGPVTVADGASFHVHIAFENDVYVQPLRIMAGNQEIPYWEWDLLNEWMNNGAVDFDYSLKGEQSSVILYAQTGVDNPATGETEWTTTSNKVTVNAVSQAGTLSPASFTIANQTVTQGDYLRVTVSAVDQNTRNTTANVESLDHTITRGGYPAAVDSNTILVPTVSLEPGTYTLNVDCSAIGYRMSRATAIFVVTAPETPVEIGLTAARNEILTNQSVLISGYAPGAAYLDISFYDDPNGETAPDTRYGYDGYIDAYYSWTHDGTKLVKLNAYYHGQDTVSTELSVSVNTSNGGSTPNPTITVPATLAFGSDLEVNYSAPGAERLRFKLFNGSYGNSYCMFDRTIQLGDNKSGIFRFDASLFESSG